MGMVHDLSSNCCDEDVGRILVSDYLPRRSLYGFELRDVCFELCVGYTTFIIYSTNNK
ncbi:hypothetical protein Hanom_Chr03g00249331 [Helianthus anomalus]